MLDVDVASAERTDLEAVFRAEGEKMWRALLGFTGSPEMASDAVSEAFAQALARGREIRSPSAWIWKVAFQIAAGELRRRSRTQPTPVDDPVLNPDTRRDIVLALQRISPNQRASVLMHDYAGYDTREVASILGMSRATVRVHLSQGRRRLRELLEDYR
jgi:RNA polymerase sigma-70 factor, ECF subfamily